MKPLTVPRDRLDDGNQPLVEHAAELHAAGNAYPIDFLVQYELADASDDEYDALSSADHVRVTEAGDVEVLDA